MCIKYNIFNTMLYFKFFKIKGGKNLEKYLNYEKIIINLFLEFIFFILFSILKTFVYI